MKTREDLNGKTGVAEKYFPDKDKYKIVMEGTKEKFLLSANHLKRRDRTPRDCGYFLIFNGVDTRGSNMFTEIPCFTSKVDAEAYYAAIQAADADKEAKAAAETAQAEETAAAAAADLIAELEMEDASGTRNNASSGKKKKSGKKGKKKK